jgi:HK97 family phage prohead protease
MERQSRAPVCEVKLLAAPLAAVTEAGMFEGYASLFGVADLGGDLVLPGAFSASLARRGAGGVRMLWQHDPAQPIGRWTAIVEDGRGLRVRGQLNLAVARAREIHALMKEGAVDGLSIGFRVERARRDRAGVRRLERLDLWEISLVTFPMLPGARVSGVKRHRSPSPRSGGACHRAGRRPDPLARVGPPAQRGEELARAIRRASWLFTSQPKRTS